MGKRYSKDYYDMMKKYIKQLQQCVITTACAVKSFKLITYNNI